MGMYFEIVDYCNMRCAHCGMSAKTEHMKSRQRMSWDTFRNAISLVDRRDDHWMTIGGGEPTLHPMFVRFCETILENTEWNLGVITNGTRPSKVRWMLNTMEHYREDRNDDRFSANLSLDDFHDRSMVKDWVVSAFKLRGHIRSVTSIIRVGRAKTNPLSSIYYRDNNPMFTNLRHCFCESTHVKPNGDVYPCGCDDIPCIGNVNSEADREWLRGELMTLDCCWHTSADPEDQTTWAELWNQGRVPVQEKPTLVLDGANSH